MAWSAGRVGEYGVMTRDVKDAIVQMIRLLGSPRFQQTLGQMRWIVEGQGDFGKGCRAMAVLALDLRASTEETELVIEGEEELRVKSWGPGRG